MMDKTAYQQLTDTRLPSRPIITTEKTSTAPKGNEMNLNYLSNHKSDFYKCCFNGNGSFMNISKLSNINKPPSYPVTSGSVCW